MSVVLAILKKEDNGDLKRERFYPAGNYAILRDIKLNGKGEEYGTDSSEKR